MIKFEVEEKIEDWISRRGWFKGGWHARKLFYRIDRGRYVSQILSHFTDDLIQPFLASRSFHAIPRDILAHFSLYIYLSRKIDF